MIHFDLVASRANPLPWCCLRPLAEGDSRTTNWSEATCPRFGRLAHTVYVDTPAKRAAVRSIFPDVDLPEPGDYAPREVPR